MPDTIERRLQGAADATDTLVSGWSDGADLPPVPVARRMRTIRRRLVYPAVCAAAVAAVVVTVVALTGPAQHHTSVGDGAPPSSSPTAPPATDPPTRAAQVLADALVELRDVTTSWAVDGSYEVDAGLWQRGVQVATVSLTVTQRAPAIGNLCVRAKTLQALKGARVPDDVCTTRPQPDGTVVSIWKANYNRPWRTAHVKEWNIVQVRGDGAVVSLDVDSEITPPNSARSVPASAPWHIPVSTLVRIVTAPQVVMDGPCTHDCRGGPSATAIGILGHLSSSPTTSDPTPHTPKTRHS